MRKIRKYNDYLQYKETKDNRNYYQDKFVIELCYDTIYCYTNLIAFEEDEYLHQASQYEFKHHKMKDYYVGIDLVYKKNEKAS